MLVESIITVAYLFFFQTTSCADKCVWTVDGFDFDISSLEGTILEYSDVSTEFNYSYTPCKNDLDCGSSKKDYMAVQTKAGGNCHELATFNESVVPKEKGNALELHYTGGESGRSFTARWECGSSTYEVTSCEEETGTLTYTMTIKSSLSCFGGSGSSTEGGGLSVGWIIIIAFGGCVFLYCLIGYIICAKKNPDNGWGNVKANTPHLDFWCLVPKLTWAGCCVTKEFTVSTVNKLRGKGGEDGEYESVE